MTVLWLDGEKWLPKRAHIQRLTFLEQNQSRWKHQMKF